MEMRETLGDVEGVAMRCEKRIAVISEGDVYKRQQYTNVSTMLVTIFEFVPKIVIYYYTQLSSTNCYLFGCRFFSLIPTDFKNILKLVFFTWK